MCTAGQSSVSPQTLLPVCLDCSLGPTPRPTQWRWCPMPRIPSRVSNPGNGSIGAHVWFNPLTTSDASSFKVEASIHTPQNKGRCTEYSTDSPSAYHMNLFFHLITEVIENEDLGVVMWPKKRRTWLWHGKSILHMKRRSPSGSVAVGVCTAMMCTAIHC